jgi:cytochrome c peroxidase
MVKTVKVSQNLAILIFMSILMLLLTSLGCRFKSDVDDKLLTIEIPLGLDQSAMQIPEDNPLTKAKVDLGRKLYFDERLSIDATISCAFCHNPLLAFADGRYLAMGVLGHKGQRNSSTILNRVFSREQFFDGRAKNLEEVVLAHIQNPKEMNNTLENVVKIISADKYYRQSFRKAFNTKVTTYGIAKAIASFVRTLISGNSPYDKFMAGDKNALSESAQRGLKLFQSERLNCTACHNGLNFTDENYHNNGAGQDLEVPDLGRYNQTKEDSDRGKFKTPTLRDIARTSPYMHNGSLKSLLDVVNFYDQGGIPNQNLSEEVKPLRLTEQEKLDLVNFLRSLTGGNILFMGNI